MDQDNSNQASPVIRQRASDVPEGSDIKIANFVKGCDVRIKSKCGGVHNNAKTCYIIIEFDFSARDF